MTHEKKIHQQKTVFRNVVAGLTIAICIFSILTASKLRLRRLNEIVDATCNPICIYGIKPGETTIDEALNKLSVISFPWQMEVISSTMDSSLAVQTNQLSQSGTVRWGRDLHYPFLGEYGKIFDYATFRKTDLSSPKIISVRITANNTLAKSVKDFIEVLGPPSHVWPYTSPVWPSPENGQKAEYQGVGAALIYEGRGFEIRLSLVPKTSSQDLFIENANVDAFISSVMVAGIPENRNYDLSVVPKWQGYKDYSFYCSQIPQAVSECL